MAHGIRYDHSGFREVPVRGAGRVGSVGVLRLGRSPSLRMTDFQGTGRVPCAVGRARCVYAVLLSQRRYGNRREVFDQPDFFLQEWLGVFDSCE